MVLGRQYPREVFSINESLTKVKMATYDRKYDAWYEKAVEMFPDYYSMSLRDRVKVRQTIDDAVGYSL